MNTISLNNLWVYLQGLTLTANNKKWLADHLYESARSEDASLLVDKSNWPKLTKEDLVISPEVMALVEDFEPTPADVNLDQMRLDYLMEKYG